jgi:hypothetical protein
VIARLAAWLLLGLLSAGAALADDPASAPGLAVDPDEPGPSLPPVGRSLFDFLTVREIDGRSVQVVPFPFTALLDQIEAEVGLPEPSLRKVLIPLGRSLQRNAANPDFFAFPRAVVAVDQGPGWRADASGMLFEDRLYLGYQEKAATIEVISYNEAAGRFEYQVVRDYREGGAADVYYADRETCIACHRNHAPIFSKPLWDETNANAAIAATLIALDDSFYGIPVARGIDVPNAFDLATDRANTYAALQRIWQEGCEVPGAPATGIACRADALLALLQYKLAGNRHPASDRMGPAHGFTAALEPQWDALWPGGLAIPDADIPNRAPLTEPLDPHVPLSEAEAIRLTTIERAFEPFEPRPPREVWHAPATPEQGRQLVAGLAQFVATADIQRLDDFLWAQDVPTTEIETACEVRTVALARERRELRIDCAGPEGLMLQGHVQLQGREVLGGAISRLQIDGEVLTNLKVAGGGYIFHRVGPTLLVLQLEERAAGLHARLPDGRTIRHLAIEGSPGSDWPHRVATLAVADDFALVRIAVAAMRAQAARGASDALAMAPLRRAAVMPALFAALGADPIEWCCLDATAMPAAALEP